MVSIVTQDASSSTSQDGEMFAGDVRIQTLVADEDAPSLRVAAVTFLDGARNRWHRHTCEQVLVVTAGEGIIADNRGEHSIKRGDVVLVHPNERHWHGAKPGKSLTHLAILLPSNLTIDPDQTG